MSLVVSILSLAAVAADEPAPGDRALLVVRLPAAAKLLVDEVETKQSGAERKFQTPALQAGKKYSYQLKATWQENGEERVVTRKAFVRAGEQTTVDLTKPEPEVAAAARSRTFEFTYAATVTDIPAGKVARIWLPVAHADDYQDAAIVSKKIPGDSSEGREPKFGNQILYTEAKAGADGTIPLEIVYRITRREAKGSQPEAKNAEQALFLQANAKVPVGGMALGLIKDKKLPEDQLATAHVLYDVVNNHMRYSKKGTGWGQGDSDWACQSGYGNCTDFHSLFMSLARAQKIPTKFEIGFPLPPQHGSGDIPGYHCWAFFRPQGHGWTPVDISEANKNPKLRDYYFGNLTADRLALSTGRDIDLVPKQDGAPLNYFVDPYVEVDGKPLAADKVKKKFSFKDLSPDKK
jgi:uncharacterized protein (TIGR03000 family)